MLINIRTSELSTDTHNSAILGMSIFLSFNISIYNSVALSHIKKIASVFTILSFGIFEYAIGVNSVSSVI